MSGRSKEYFFGVLIFFCETRVTFESSSTNVFFILTSKLDGIGFSKEISVGLIGGDFFRAETIQISF